MAISAIRLFLAIAFGLGFLVLGQTFYSSNLDSLIQFTALIIVGSTSAGLLCMVRNPRDMLKFAVSFWKKYSITPAERQEAVQIVRTMELGNLLGGVLGTGAGLIHVLAHMDMPDQIGPGIVVSVVSLFYSVLFNALVCLPLLAVIDRKSAASFSDDRPQHFSGFRQVMGAVLLVAGVTIGILLEGGQPIWFFSLPSALASLAPAAALWLMHRRIGVDANARLYAKGFLCGGIMGAIMAFIHCMENLGGASQLWLQVGIVFIPILYGTMGATYFGLKVDESPTESAYKQQALGTGTYALYSAFSTALFSSMILLVFFALEIKP